MPIKRRKVNPQKNRVILNLIGRNARWLWALIFIITIVVAAVLTRGAIIQVIVGEHGEIGWPPNGGRCPAP